MLAVLLNILKVIGIIILVVLGIIILLLFMILFIPIRYRAKGAYQEKKAFLQGRVTWFLHSVSVWAEYEYGQPFHMRVKILGIPVLDNQKPKRDRNKKNKRTKNNTSDNVDAGAIMTASVIEENPDADADDSGPRSMEASSVQVPYEEYQNDGESTSEGNGQNQPAEAHDDRSSEKGNCFQKIKAFFLKFVNIFKNIKFTIQKICDTIRKIKDNIKYYLELLQLDSTKQAFAVCKTQSFRVLKKIIPAKYDVKLHLGFADPAVLGEVLAVWGMLYPFHQGAIEIQPEFEQEVMEGSFHFKGRISIFVLVRAGCVCYFDKNIRQLIKHFKNGRI